MQRYMVEKGGLFGWHTFIFIKIQNKVNVRKYNALIYFSLLRTLPFAHLLFDILRNNLFHSHLSGSLIYCKHIYGLHLIEYNIFTFYALLCAPSRTHTHTSMHLNRFVVVLSNKWWVSLWNVRYNLSSLLSLSSSRASFYSRRHTYMAATLGNHAVNLL